MINGIKVKRPEKQDLANDIADSLQIVRPRVSSGASVDSMFLEEVYQAITGHPSAAKGAYRTVEAVLDALGLSYDAFWDTSESSPTGGSTVTTRAYSRIRTGITKIPRCFILNVTDAPAGAKWETTHESSYHYDETVSGRLPLNDAGPGSRVIYYSTSKSKKNPMHFNACAEIDYVAGGWSGPWATDLKDYREFPAPVPSKDVTIEGWNRQNAITEIKWETYVELVGAGGLSATHETHAGSTPDPTDSVDDPGGSQVARKAINAFAGSDDPAPLDVPSLPTKVGTSTLPTPPSYIETPEGVQTTRGTYLPSLTSNPGENKLAEHRAVDLATLALTKAGWTLHRDCQSDGVGYDLDFLKNGEHLHVEVKGIKASKLTFNLTPKEYWRAETDDRWVVVAVTNVLAPTPEVHLLTRDRVVAANRVVTGFRLIL
ncbi:hypothetical protein AWH69_07900 [Janibacter melonis]|uniref:Protein NO VEIN C-terminal domain-containing protein n=1 Tax=Janibacter melonis TaxID=262209 RepID=A0A176QE40_9MICO|nr:DUF3883 domain-containing protein [Janibacter melonis]OAB87933.1 hypothetical protein AWH69_07900 [Janibacter melonis]